MAEQGNQGNGSQGQESGAGNQGQGQESASQDQQGNQSGQQAQGQESGQGGQQQGQQEQGGNTPDVASMSEADLRAYAAKLQKDVRESAREAATYRTTAQTAQQQLTEAQRAQMTEQQRIEHDLQQAQTAVQERDTQLQALQAQVEDLTRGAAIREALAQAGAINPQTAQKVGTWDAVKLKEDGSLDPDSFQAQLTALKTSDPYLFRRGASADAGAGTGGGSAPEAGSSINDMIRGRRG
jgi:hypothetical protein